MDAGSSERGHKCTCEVCTTSAVQCDGQLQVRAKGEEEEEEPPGWWEEGPESAALLPGINVYVGKTCRTEKENTTEASNMFRCFSQANWTMGNHVRHQFVPKWDTSNEENVTISWYWHYWSTILYEVQKTCLKLIVLAFSVASTECKLTRHHQR